jgi:flagellar motor switch protein FliN/FliY
MATTHPLPSAAVSEPELASQNTGNEPAASQALVPVPAMEPEPGPPSGVSGPVALLPVELDVAVPVRDFRVRDLLALEPGRVIETLWGNGEDVPLAAGDVQLAWSEFEVVETQLAVRVTRLA